MKIPGELKSVTAEGKVKEVQQREDGVSENGGC